MTFLGGCLVGKRDRMGLQNACWSGNDPYTAATPIYSSLYGATRTLRMASSIRLRRGWF